MSVRFRRALVTGGAGFIGSELVRQLEAQGTAVTVVDNLTNGKKHNLEGVLGDRVRLVIGDIRDSELMKGLLTDAEVVFHLACLGVRHSIHSPWENHEVNAGATLKLLMIAKEKGVQRFVFTSSSEVYGTARQVPMTEEHPTFPHTVYGSSKLAAECYTRAFHETYSFPSIVLRPFNSFGPRSHHEGDSGEVIPKFLLRCLAGKPLIVFGDGKQTRDFTYVSDTVRGIILASSVDAAVGKTINIGSGTEITVGELAETVKQVSGKPLCEIKHEASRPGDVLRLFADVSKAKQLLGFECQTSFTKGLNSLRDWYLNQDSSPEVLLEQEVIRNWEQTGAKADAKL